MEATAKRLTTHDMSYIALFSALIAICAWICIPTAVPFTMQTFAIFAALATLGGKRGCIAIAVYILLGLTGLPVFSGFRGGVGVLFGMTGGYIVGFIPAGLIFWLIMSRFKNSTAALCAAMLAGLLVCYIFGTLWFAYMYSGNTGSAAIATALSACVIPFIIPDLAKLTLALYCSKRFKKFVS